MKIVVDTNVLISGIFFGGFPREILSAIIRRKITACATLEIMEEYEEIVQEMLARKQGHLHRDILIPFLEVLSVAPSVSHIAVCRDPDDDKFISCAKDAGALYLVSGDKDLLVLQAYQNIRIVTAKDFCEEFLQ